MKLSISGPTSMISAAVREYIRRRFLFALDRFGSKIRSLKVRLIDVNGPRGGIDKECAVVVNLSEGGTLAVSGAACEAYVAIDATAERVKRAVGRAVHRRRR